MGVTPVVVSAPLEVPETQAVVRECPDVGTQAQKAEAQAGQVPPLVEERLGVSPSAGEEELVSLADTVFAQAVGEHPVSKREDPSPPLAPVRDATFFSRESLIKEQRQDPSLAPLWKRAVTPEESDQMAVGSL